MLRFAARRLAMLVVSLLVASFAIYGALYVAPGDPVATLLGGGRVHGAAAAEVRHRYHLDRPFFVRYGDWLVDSAHGNLGYSIGSRENVSTLIGQRAGVTVELVLYASVLILVFGIAAGVLAALRPGIVDTGTVVITTVFAALPSFVAALILITLFAVRVNWFPAIGEGGGDFLGRLHHLTMPAIALAVTSSSLVARVTRAAVREELRREHVQTAISRGLPRRLVLRRHVLRNAAIPIVTVSGLTVASLVALVSIVEQAFQINGLGATLVEAAESKDFAVVQAIALIMVIVFIVANAAVDLLYAVMDPRVKLGANPG